MILFVVNITFCDVHKCSSTTKYSVHTTYQMTLEDSQIKKAMATELKSGV